MQSAVRVNSSFIYSQSAIGDDFLVAFARQASKSFVLNLGSTSSKVYPEVVCSVNGGGGDGTTADEVWISNAPNDTLLYRLQLANRRWWMARFVVDSVGEQCSLTMLDSPRMVCVSSRNPLPGASDNGPRRRQYWAQIFNGCTQRERSPRWRRGFVAHDNFYLIASDLRVYVLPVLSYTSKSRQSFPIGSLPFSHFLVCQSSPKPPTPLASIRLALLAGIAVLAVIILCMCICGLLLAAREEERAKRVTNSMLSKRQTSSIVSHAPASAMAKSELDRGQSAQESSTDGIRGVRSSKLRKQTSVPKRDSKIGRPTKRISLTKKTGRKSSKHLLARAMSQKRSGSAIQ